MPRILAKLLHSFAPSFSSAPNSMESRHDVAIVRFDGSYGRVRKPEDGHLYDENWPRKWHLKFRRFLTLTRTSDLWGQGQDINR